MKKIKSQPIQIKMKNLTEKKKKEKNTPNFQSIVTRENEIYLFKFSKAYRGGYEYGFNCSLYVNNIKVSSTKGCGYDLEGVCLAKFLKLKFPNENIPDGSVGFRYIMTHFFKRLMGYKLNKIHETQNLIILN